LGDEVPIFERTDDGAQLTRVFIFSDGLASIGTRPGLIPLEEIFERFDSAQPKCAVQDGTRATVDELGSFQCKAGAWGVNPKERIKEMKGMLAKLTGGQEPVDACLAMYEAYVKQPSTEGLESLRTAYEAVPDHLKLFCGDQDSKDGPIRRLLYGK
jgi:hypothetical protein